MEMKIDLDQIFGTDQQDASDNSNFHRSAVSEPVSVGTLSVNQ